MHKSIVPMALLCAFSAAHAEQQAPTASPAGPVPAASAPAAATPAVAAAATPAARQLSLPANSDILVTVVTPLKSGKDKVGDTFKIVTAEDTLVDGAVVVPKGTAGEGRVTFSKAPGSFGKSGKMEVAFTSLSMGGQTVPLQGRYREEGQANGGAATGAVVAAGLIGGLLVHGHAVEIAQGKVMHAQTVEVLTVPAPAAATPVN